VLFNVSMCLRRSGVSCKNAGIKGTSCFAWKSTNWLIFSVMELHLLTIGLPGGRFGGVCFLCTLKIEMTRERLLLRHYIFETNERDVVVASKQ
jgi:hypothetical protein